MWGTFADFARLFVDRLRHQHRSSESSFKVSAFKSSVNDLMLQRDWNFSARAYLARQLSSRDFTHSTLEDSVPEFGIVYISRPRLDCDDSKRAEQCQCQVIDTMRREPRIFCVQERERERVKGNIGNHSNARPDEWTSVTPPERAEIQTLARWKSRILCKQND